MPKLTIKRSSEWNNRMRTFYITLDGVDVGKINNGQEISFDLNEGKHNVKAKIDWCSSETFDFQLHDGIDKTIHISGFRFGNLVIPFLIVLFLASILEIWLIETKTRISLYLILITMIYPIYYITFGRNRYLRWIDPPKA